MATSACCGAGVISVECTDVCEECGCVLETDDLVHSYPLPSSEYRPGASGANDGTGRFAPTCGPIPTRAESITRLQTRANCAALELGLPASVTKEVSILLEFDKLATSFHLARADSKTATTVLLYMGVRMDQHPESLRSLCSRSAVDFFPAAKLFTAVSKKMPTKLLPVPVRPLRSTRSNPTPSNGQPLKTRLRVADRRAPVHALPDRRR
jgi:hypothetical protein